LVALGARYYARLGPKAIEIGDQSPAISTIDRYKKDFSSGSLVINEVVLGAWLNKDKQG
jgi:hypothetical protein